MCRSGLDYQAGYRAYLARRGAIATLVDGMDVMEEDERREVTRFLDEFWETLDDPGRASRRIERVCRSI